MDAKRAKELKPYKLKKEEANITRLLWEEVFSEDSREFVDYYYEYKAPQNDTFVIGDRPDLIMAEADSNPDLEMEYMRENMKAMLHLTPYEMVLRTNGSHCFPASYIIGVATKEEFRHRGYMNKLLHASLHELYARKEPFTFLMPASPSIYEPFSFAYIYEREEYSLLDTAYENSELRNVLEGREDRTVMQLENSEKISIQRLQLSDAGILADFAKEQLEKQYDFYLQHTRAYFETLFWEVKSQNGSIIGIFQDGRLIGYFICTFDMGNIFFQEILLEQNIKVNIFQNLFKTALDKKPIIMGRIIHLEKLLSYFFSDTKKRLYFYYEDNIIEQNTGFYEWIVGPDKSVIKKQIIAKGLSEKQMSALKVRPDELISYLFTEKSSNDFVLELFQGIEILKNGIMNEIV